MSDLTRQKLKYIISQYGRSICGEPKRCANLLKDLAPGDEHKAKIHILVSALEDGIVQELLKPSILPQDMLFNQLAERLKTDLGFSKKLCHWAIDTWAFALGISSGKSNIQVVSSTSSGAVQKNPSKKPGKFKRLAIALLAVISMWALYVNYFHDKKTPVKIVDIPPNHTPAKPVETITTVTVKPTQTITTVEPSIVKSVPLPDKFGLTIDTDPADANIRIEDAQISYQPGMELSPGTYNIEISKDGYKSEKHQIEIKSSPLRFFVRLEELLYAFTINADPVDARVKILKIPQKYQPGMKLKPGKYNVEVSLDGYETQKEKFEIKDSDFILDVKLKPIETTPVSSTTTPVKSDSDVTYLRNKPATLSDDDVNAMIKKNNFFCKRYSWSEKWYNESGNFKNDCVDNGNDTITDRATGLIWQKAGSSNYMTFNDAKKYIDDLNQNEFAGSKKWRLPTIEELASLLEPDQKDGLYIDPKFNRTQKWCWSSDERSSGGAWHVDFYYGYVNWYNLNDSYYVRGVRSGQ